MKGSVSFTLDELSKLLPGRSITPVLHALLDKGYIDVFEKSSSRYQAKKEKFIFLTSAYTNEDSLKQLLQETDKHPARLRILLTYLHLHERKSSVRSAELLQQASSSRAVLDGLIRKEIFTEKKLEVDRLQYTQTANPVRFILTDDQQAALQQIKTAFSDDKPVLLHGITGSGKTHVYLACIQEALEAGNQALYLLPEIALTAQMVKRIRATFGERIAVYHSRFSANERVEIWQKVLRHEVDLVIGARSALWLPFARLGLILVDEEQDASFKQQDPAPRFHARDAALYLAQQSGANIILGSATPSVESYQHALTGKYTLVELRQRYGEARLPDVQLVNMRVAMEQKQVHGLFSQPLLRSMEESFHKGEQVILFQNRRGYAAQIQCGTCGWIPHCAHCDVSLTYHKLSDQMHCHYCGTKTAPLRLCPVCGAGQLKSRQFGTEKIEEEIRKQFPGKTVERFDWDALRIRNKHEDILHRFEKGRIDILIGTQMLVKGLDFEQVTTVGVLQADSLLAHPDFRVHERVFQLLEQVSGRAGRKAAPGRVWIQAFQVQHPVLQYVQQHAYTAFFQDEIRMRNTFGYPPFIRLIRIQLKHKKQQTVQQAAAELAQQLATMPEIILLGPAEPDIARVRNMYLMEIMLKLQRDTRTLHQQKNIILQQMALLKTIPAFRSVILFADVDPLG